MIFLCHLFFIFKYNIDSRYKMQVLTYLICIFFIETLRQLTHVVGNLSHRGVARRALPASGGEDAVGGE